MKKLVQRLGRTTVGRVLGRYLSRNGPNQATMIAWNLLFAIFPIVILAVTVAGLVFRSPALGQDVAKAVAAILPQGKGSAVLGALDAFHRDSGVLAIVGIVGLIWSGTSLFGAMDQGFAALGGGKSRSFLPQKLMSVAMILLFTVLTIPIVLSSSLLAGLEGLHELPSWLHSGPLPFLIQVVVAILAGTVLFTAIYSLVPHQRRRLGAILRGALTAGIVFEALSLLFPLYFKLEHGFSSYGSTFALFFLILAFAFLVAQITVLGYTMAVVLDPREQGTETKTNPRPPSTTAAPAEQASVTAGPKGPSVAPPPTSG